MFRKLVSKDKLRYQDDQFDLDLTFITDRIVAMGLPGENIGSLWRNDIDDVSKFFRIKFNEHFQIINLSGVHYDYSKFDHRVVDFAFADHNCPPLEMLCSIVKTMDRFLSQDSANVVAVHCLAGRGRTGTVIAAYLLYIHAFETPKEALDYFAEKRSSKCIGVIGPSQIRYVEYFHRMMQGNKLRHNRKLFMKQICVSPIPAIDIGSSGARCTPAIEVFSKGIRVFSTIDKRSETFSRGKDTDVNLEVGVYVSDDVQIQFYHCAKSQMKFMELIGSCKLLAKEAVTATIRYPYIPLFRYTFHTSFLDNSPVILFTLSKPELDAPFEGKAKDTMFPTNMTVTTFFLDLALLEVEKIHFEPTEAERHQHYYNK